MDKDLTRIPENAASKAFDREREKYPVQRVSVVFPITERDIESAVEEINPDQDSLDFRG